MSVNSYLSEAFSIYTVVTSVIESAASAASASSNSASTAGSSSSASTTSSSSGTTTSSSSSATPTSPTSASGFSTASSTGTSSVLANAAATSAAAATSTHHGISGTTLAIILGCVLGALVLGLLLLVLLICCRRRRRRDRSPRLLSPDGKEIDSWRNSSRDRTGSRAGLFGRHRNNGYGRSSTPNIEEHPAFKNDHEHQNPFVPVPPPPRRSANNSRAGLTDGTVPGQDPYLKNANGGPLNLNDTHHKDHHGGAIAAGVGGAALGAAALHHHDKKKYEDSDLRHSGDQKRGLFRKPVAHQQPFPTTTMNDDPYALNKAPSRRSNEHPRFSADDYGHPYENTQRGLPQPNTGTQLSPFNSSGHTRVPSGDNSNHHSAMLATGAGAVGGAAMAHHHRTVTKSRSPRRSYDAAKTPGPNTLLDTSNHPLPENRAKDQVVSPVSTDSYSSALNGHVQQPLIVSKSNSGSSASYPPHDRSSISHEMPADVPAPSRSHRNSIGNRPLSTTGPPAAALLAHSPNQHRRNQTPPAVPSRSPKRTHFNEDPAAAQFPPQDSSHTASSDDSTWRLSSGMPGGWGGRNSGRRDSFDAARNGEHLRNSGINPHGRLESPVRSNPRRQSVSPGGMGVHGQGRRLRLADLRRQEEERGRRSMGSEWAGDGPGGYGGYDNHGFTGQQPHGVGQAM